jgi:hypothetical protein
MWPVAAAMIASVRRAGLLRLPATGHCEARDEHDDADAMPWTLTRTETESFRRYGLSEHPVGNFYHHEDRGPGEPGSPRPIAPVNEKLTQFDLNLPYSRTVEMYMSSGMLKLGCRTTAAAVRRITKS